MKERMFAGKEALNAFLGEGTSFKGILSFEGTVRIEGKLDGEIYSKDTLVLGEGAVVRATIQAGTVVISGTVHGDIIAEKKIQVLASGRVYGNLTTPSLSIEEGVIFEGTCTMSRKGQPPLADVGSRQQTGEELLAAKNSLDTK